MAHSWRGVFPAATTQFDRDGNLDLAATQRHLDVVIGSGVHGLVMLGSLGENNALSRSEKLDVVRAAKEVANGRVPVLSGVSETSTAAACDYVRAAQAAGAEGFMVMPAMAYHADSKEAIAHFSAVAQATDLDIVVYNNPLAYLVDLAPQHLETLASHQNLVAVKESSGDPRRITDLKNALGDRYTIFGGVDDLALEATLLGADGWISGIGLAFPAENAQLWDLMQAQDWTRARELYRWYSPLLHLDVGRKFVQNIKLAIQEMGLGAEWVRLPRLPLEGTERQAVLDTLHRAAATKPSWMD